MVFIWLYCYKVLCRSKASVCFYAPLRGAFLYMALLCCYTFQILIKKSSPCITRRRFLFSSLYHSSYRHMRSLLRRKSGAAYLEKPFGARLGGDFLFRLLAAALTPSAARFRFHTEFTVPVIAFIRYKYISKNLNCQ